MADWDHTKVHCLVTWLTLVDLDQTSRGFGTTGNAKMTNLTFWNPGDSVAIRRAKARTVAIQSDNLFKRYWGTTYEQGKSRSKAINAALRCMTDKDKTVADLAEANDEHYLYYGE